MASKAGLAGGIPERKVRPIWDAVDSRQYKSALKFCSALLPKYPNSAYLLALKALVLERMGKPDEALNACVSAREQLLSSDISQMDDLTLSTLQMVLQRLNRLDLATSCYEHACGKYPNNLDLMIGLFNCYVHEYSYVKQQQTAIKMYKIVGEERFLLWAVCSIQLQVSCGNAGDKLLALSEGLLKKHLATFSLHEPEALLVYISILERQGKYGAALEIISGSLGSLMPIEVDKYRIQGRLLARSGDFSAAVEIFHKVLEICPDDWGSFLHYLGCLLEDPDMSGFQDTVSSTAVLKNKDVCRRSHLSEDLFEERLAIASSFIRQLMLKVNGDSVRCPFLATIEIEKCRRLHGGVENGRILEALLEYFCRFSHMSCFASDIEIFLDVLSHVEREELLVKFMTAAEDLPLRHTELQSLRQFATIFRIKEVFKTNFKLSISDLRAASFDLVDMFCKKLYLSGDLDPQETVHGEELLTMASNALSQLFWRTGRITYLLEAIIVLEFGLTIGRHAWQYKIHLVHLYSHLGALPLAYERFGSLNVKNILLETVSHHALPQMLKSTHWVELSLFLSNYLKFMDDYMREAADHTFLAYRHRNYTKVVEFVQFKEKLQNSVQYLLAKVETSILELKQKAGNLEETERTLESFDFGTKLLDLSTDEKLKTLTFNEDMEARPWWSPTPDVNLLLQPYDSNYYSSRKPAENWDDVARKAVKRRSLIPRLLHLSIRTAAKEKDDVSRTAATSGKDDIGQLSSELDSLLEQYSATLGQPLEEAINTIVSVSAQCKPLEGLGSDLSSWVSLAVFLNASNLYRRPKGEPVAEKVTWPTVNNLIQRCISECLISSTWSPLGAHVAALVQLITEACSWHVLVIHSRLRSMPPPSSGKRKKKTSLPAEPPPASNTVHASAGALRTALNEAKQWLDRQLSATLEADVDATLSGLGGEDLSLFQRLNEVASNGGDDNMGETISRALQSWDSAAVAKKLVQSRRRALTELQRICEHRLKSVDSLREAGQ
ncbi:tetratricopeptide repeat (TPR)-like superfamily protein isoform X2 [Wolffia australiana]